MAELTTRKADGSEGASITVDDATFAVQPNVSLMHQVVTAQLAAARAGTQSTKTRSEVSGGGAKPFKQKGTGRSRQGTTRAPQWTGGGVALGPKPRSYKQRTPKKMVKAALRSALSDRFADGKIVVLEGGFGFPEAKTKHAAALLTTLDLTGRVMVVVERDDETAGKAFRNLQEVKLVLVDELNAYDVLVSDWVVFTEATLPKAKAGSAVPTTGSAGGAADAGAADAETADADSADAGTAEAASVDVDAADASTAPGSQGDAEAGATGEADTEPEGGDDADAGTDEESQS
jgi:large subunit ribosomal protein L4